MLGGHGPTAEHAVLSTAPTARPLRHRGRVHAAIRCKIQKRAPKRGISNLGYVNKQDLQLSWGGAWKDRVVPFAVKFVGLQIDLCEFFIRDLATDRILSVIQAASHL